jgi:hypothetical protein
MDNNTSSIVSSSASTKEDFNATVTRLNEALERHDAVYPSLISAVSGFDKQLAAKIAACAAADADLAQYLKSKVERGENRGIMASIVSLLLSR